MIARTFFFAVLASVPFALQAHHSINLNFSLDETATIEGTIRSVSWINPHSSFVLEVTNEDGTTEEWRIEMKARIALQRAGFDFDALQEGTHIQLTGNVGYHERTLLYRSATLPDGRILERLSPVSGPPSR